MEDQNTSTVPGDVGPTPAPRRCEAEGASGVEPSGKARAHRSGVRRLPRWLLILLLIAGVLACSLVASERAGRVGTDVMATRLDGIVPPNLGLTLVYLGYFPYLMWVFVGVARRRCFFSHFRPTLSIALVSLFVFLAVPTRVARPELDPAAWNTYLIHCIQEIDAPGNAFPSLHVSLAIFASYLAVRHRMLSAWAAMAVTIGIVVSTLSTHQHLFLDVFGGALVAYGAYRWDRTRTPVSECCRGGPARTR